MYMYMYIHVLYRVPCAKVSDFVRILRIFDLAKLPRTDCPPIAITPDSWADGSRYGVARVTQVQRSRNYCAHDVDVYCMTVLYHYCRVTVLSEGVSSLNEEKESSDNESEHLKYRYLLCILTVICHYVVFGFLRIFSWTKLRILRMCLRINSFDLLAALEYSSIRSPLKLRHLSKRDTFFLPKYHVCVLFNPWNKDTSLIRTLSSGPIVSRLEEFHCMYNNVMYQCCTR